MAEYRLQYTANEINEKLRIIQELEKLLGLTFFEDTDGNLILEFLSIDGNDIYQ